MCGILQNIPLINILTAFFRYKFSSTSHHRIQKNNSEAIRMSEDTQLKQRNTVTITTASTSTSEQPMEEKKSAHLGKDPNRYNS